VTTYLVVPLLVVVVILQATVVPHLAVWGVFADLPVLLVVSWGLLRGPREGILWGFIAGVVVDLISGAPFGAATFSLMVVGLLSGLGKSSIFAGHIVFPVVTMFLSTVLYNMCFLLIVWISGQRVAWLDSSVRIVLPSAVLNAILAPTVFLPMRWVCMRFGQEEMEW
jgi:rod shape-determining protein MreD